MEKKLTIELTREEAAVVTFGIRQTYQLARDNPTLSSLLNIEVPDVAYRLAQTIEGEMAEMGWMTY